MRRTTKRGWALGVMVVAFAASPLGCGDSDDQPQVRIISPNPGATIQLGSDMKARFTISANDFELKTPTQCTDQTHCGVAYLNIDGDACNQPGKPYNNVLGDGTLGQDFFVDADFSFCPPASRLGQHNVTVSLRNPAGQPVKGEGGSNAQASLSVVTTQ
jgi:hypothetical protein